MATEIPVQASSLGSTLSGVANLANLFLGSTTNTNSNTTGTTTNATDSTVTDNRSSTTVNSGGTTTQTTQSSVSGDAVNALIKSVLEGTAGLAAVAGAQRSAGLYNSSTNMMMTNDLLARASSEAAALNRSQTVTTVTPETTQRSQNAGGTTTQGTTTQTSNQATTQAAVKQAAIPSGISAGIGAGVAALQILPKDVKDSILTGLGIKTAVKTPDSTAASTQSADSIKAVTQAGSGVDSASDIATSGTDGLSGQTITGVGTGFIPDAGVDLSVFDGTGLGQDISGGFSGVDTSGVADSVGGYDLSDAGMDTEGFDLFGGISESLDGSSIGDALGGLLSGIGDTASSVADSVGGFFDDFDFSFANGGIVSPQIRAQQMMDHMQKKANGGKVEKKKVDSKGRQHFANGGMAELNKGTVYDLQGAGYLANTGLRQSGLNQVSSGNAESNDVAISKLIRESLSSTTPQASSGTGRTPIYTRTPANTVATGNRTGANSSVSSPLDDNLGGVGVNSTDGPVGVTGATGLSSAQSSAISMALSALGIPGLSTMATAVTSPSPANSFASSIASIAATAVAGPVGGLAMSALMAALNAHSNAVGNTAAGSESVGNNNTDGYSTASVSVGEMTASDPNDAAANAAAAANNESMGVVGTTSESIGPSSSDSTASTGETGESSEGESGESGDGGASGEGSDGGAGGPGGEGGTYRNGGEIDGKGTGTSDSIPAMLSDGEYVIPADVVAALGVPFFDNMLKKHHTEVRK